MVNWPCIFKLEGDDELMYLSSELALMDEFESLIWSDEDTLIDSLGLEFRVNITPDGETVFELTGNTYSTSQVTDLVQAHEFSKVEVCLIKIQFKSVSDAIASIAHS